MVVKTGHTSLLLRDALRRPLAEVELGAVQASVRRPTEDVMQVQHLPLSGLHLILPAMGSTLLLRSSMNWQEHQ